MIKFLNILNSDIKTERNVANPGSQIYDST